MRIHQQLWACVGLCLLVSQPGTLQACDCETLPAQMDQRYAPYADWASQVELPAEPATRYWRTAAEIQAAREPDAEELEGLTLVLDPGHLGGIWAEFEGRNFRINDGDFWVREGELVLEVAQLVQMRLEALGAEVMLTRDASDPVNTKRPGDYLSAIIAEKGEPTDHSMAGLSDYLIEVRDEAVRRSVVSGELAARARLINEELQPDAVISLHINAAPWPASDDTGELMSEALQLVKANHLHVLTFGCLSQRELQSPRQQRQLLAKLSNGSGPEETALGRAMAQALKSKTGLPSSLYGGNNAIVDAEEPYLWYRNLMLLRTVECPIVLLEPYVANSEAAYLRIQDALRRRHAETEVPDDDILLEYADAVVHGVIDAYGLPSESGR